MNKQKSLTLDELEKAASHIVKKCRLQKQGKITLRVIVIDHLNTLASNEEFFLKDIVKLATFYTMNEKQTLIGDKESNKLTSRIIGLLRRLVKEKLVTKASWGKYKKV